MRSVEEHQRVVAGLIAPGRPVEVPIVGADGLVLADDVVAPLSLPVFDNSAMDGYAVLVSDVAAAGPDSPVSLPVPEDIPAGRTDRLTSLPWELYGLDRTVALAEALEPPCVSLLERVDVTAGPNYQPASRLRPHES